MVLGMAWWLCTGDYSLAVPLAIFYELFWVDLFPIGTYIPPIPAFPYLLVLSLAGSFFWSDPVTIAFPLALTLPLAYLIPFLEQKQRNYQQNASIALMSAATQSMTLDSLPGRLIRNSAGQILGIGLIIFALLEVLLFQFFTSSIFGHHLREMRLDVDWSIIFAIAAVGPLLALRIKKAYLVFAICMAALLAFM